MRCCAGRFGVFGTAIAKAAASSRELRRDVAAAPPPEVRLRAEFGFGSPVGCQGVGVVRVPRAAAGSWTRRITSIIDADGAAGQPAGERAHHEIGVAQLAGTSSCARRYSAIDGEIRRDGIESAGVHDPRAGVDGLLVVQVDALRMNIGSPVRSA